MNPSNSSIANTNTSKGWNDWMRNHAVSPEEYKVGQGAVYTWQLLYYVTTPGTYTVEYGNDDSAHMKFSGAEGASIPVFDGGGNFRLHLQQPTSHSLLRDGRDLNSKLQMPQDLLPGTRIQLDWVL